MAQRRNGLRKDLKNITTTGVMATLVFLGTLLTRFEISFLGGHIMVHLGNMFCLTAALLFGRQCGALSGAIGMSLFDLLSGRFIYYVPFIFFLKYCVGFICGHIKSKYSGKISEKKLNVISVSAALAVNAIFSPMITFFMKTVVYGLNFYLAGMQTIGSIIGVVVNSLLSGFLSLVLVDLIKPTGLCIDKKSNK